MFAATAPGLEAFGGSYLEDNAVSQTLTSECRDPEAARRLWGISETAVGAWLVSPQACWVRAA